MALTTFDTARVLTATGNSNFTPDLNSQGSADGWFAPQNLSVHILASSVGGTTPSLTVEVQWSNDGSTFVSAATPDTFTAITANGNVCKQFGIKGRFARLAYTVTGTTPTFTLTANAYFG